MRILHTADWHIGQTLNGWSREYEHQAVFCDALRDVIVAEGVDALLITGDVFDGINPSGEAERLTRAQSRHSTGLVFWNEHCCSCGSEEDRGPQAPRA